MGESEKPRAFVTGATGFIGRHLVSLLLREGYHITALCQPQDPLQVALPAAVERREGDLGDAHRLQRLLQDAKPHLLFHLAGMVSGDGGLAQFMAVNVLGTEHLLHAVACLSCPPVVVVPGSAASVGLLQHPLVGEEAPLRPLTAYGLSKAAQALLAQSYALRGLAPVVIGRIFNVTGPGEPATMLCGSIAAQIAACEAHQQPPVLYVGNLSPTRDFLDVRDVVAALWFLAQHGQAGELYNVCSGQERAVSSVVNHLLAEARLPIALKPDPQRQRPSDVPRCAGIPARLFAAGWRPNIALAQSLHDTLAWWRVALHRGPATPIDVVPQALFGGSQSSVQVVT